MASKNEEIIARKSAQAEGFRNVFCPDQLNRALSTAASYGYNDTVCYLIMLGASPQALDGLAVQQAIHNGHLELAKSMIKDHHVRLSQVTIDYLKNRAIIDQNFDIVDFLNSDQVVVVKRDYYSS